jgi:hypothetical protein
MKTNRLLLFLMVLLIAGCSAGIQIEDFEPAQGPHGVQLELKLRGDVIGGNKITGELLAARADRILLNVVDDPDSPVNSSRVVLIPYSLMKTVEPEQMGRMIFRSQRKEMDEDHLTRLRLVARFPQGLSDEMLAVLLANLGQDQVEVPRQAD